MARWLVVPLLLLGCTPQRYLVIPPSTLSVAPLEGSSTDTFRVGEIATRVEFASPSGSWNGVAAVDSTRVRQQLTDRLRETLKAQKQLGAVEKDATYSVEVEVLAKETHGFGKGLLAGIGAELGIFAVGAGTGYAIGQATDRGTPRIGGILGMGIGTLASIPLALFGALLFELGGVRGEYSAVLTLRRLSDRVPVASRHLSSIWSADYNGYGIEEKMAKFSGDAVPEFERVVVEGLKSMLLELRDPVARAP